MDKRRTAAAAALALAVLAAQPAQAQTDQLHTFMASANALPLHLEVHLPAAIPAPGGDLQTLEADISEVNGDVIAPEGDALTATADASVLASTLAPLNTAAGEPVEATLTGEKDASRAVLAQTVGPVGIGLGQIEAHVTPEGTSTSTASLASVVMSLGADGDATALVRAGAAQSTHTSGRDGDTVAATATASVANVNALGGLVTVGSVETKVTAGTSGKAGEAAATTSTKVTDLKVGDVAAISIGPDGVTGTILGNAIPTGDVGAVIDSLNGVLATAGVQIIVGDVEEEAAADGSMASASSDGIGIIVNPLKAAEPLLSLQLAPAGVGVAATRAAIPPDDPDPDEEPRAPVDPPGDELPKTGGDGGAGPLAGLSLAGGLLAAAAIRRTRANRPFPLT